LTHNELPLILPQQKNKALSEKSNQMRLAEKERYGRNVIDNRGTPEEVRRPLEENVQERQERGDD
jgi:dephospho-CoA kinase